jgi:hypothetical protein
MDHKNFMKYFDYLNNQDSTLEYLNNLDSKIYY